MRMRGEGNGKFSPGAMAEAESSFWFEILNPSATGAQFERGKK